MNIEVVLFIALAFALILASWALDERERERDGRERKRRR